MKDLIRLITDTSVFKEIPSWSTWKLIGTFFFLYFLVGAASTISYFQITRPAWQQKGMQAWQQLAQSWNKDLVIRYENGELWATPSAQITVNYPDVLPQTSGLPSSLAYLDTSTTNRPTQNQSLITLTKTEVGTFESPEKYQWIPLSEIFGMQQVTFDYDFVQNQTPYVETLLATVLAFTSIAVFAGNAIFLPLLRLGIAALFTFLTPSIFAMFSNSKNWKVAWKIGLVLLPLAELAQLLLTTLTQPEPLHAFWIIWLTLIVLINASNPRRIR